MDSYPILPKRILEAPEVGAKASFTRTLTEGDVSLFIGATWDVNPLHTSDAYASATPFKRRIVPGLLTASLATHLGGLWAFLAREMHFEFLAPVYIGDTISAEAEITACKPGGEVTIHISMRNTQGVEVARGEARGFPGKFEEG